MEPGGIEPPCGFSPDSNSEPLTAPPENHQQARGVGRFVNRFRVSVRDRLVVT